jgi:radical SAM superfamily enzyme YgiQ (UPF0313 family)
MMAFSGSAITTYGIEIVKKSLEANGHVVKEFDMESNNPIIVSCYWMEQVYDLIKWRKKYGIVDRKIIVGGNQATGYPNSLMPWVSKIYLGDGDSWDGKNEENLIDCKNPKIKKPCYQKILKPFLYEDVQQNRRTFCEMSRGCKHSCFFCQYGWIKPYRESDVEDIRTILLSAKTKSIRMFAADRFQHSQYKQIRTAMDKIGKNDTGSDVSVSFLLNNKNYLSLTNKVRVGVEGMSERLRKLVGKPLTDEQLVDFVISTKAAGIKSMDWYMIYGLPNETQDDWEGFEKLLKEIDRNIDDNYVIAIHWNAFTPSSLTPFQYHSSAWGYDRGFKDYIRNIRLEKIKLMHKPLMSSNELVTKRMLAMRSTGETKDLIYTLAMNNSLFKKKEKAILAEYKKITGKDLHAKWDIDDPMPWDEYIHYDSAKLKKIYKAKV